MPVLLAMMLQSEGMSGPPAPSAKVRLTPAPSCKPAPNGDIVVCARQDTSVYRLTKLPERYRRDEGLPRASKQIGKNTTLSAETEQAGVGGFPSNRAMIRLKMGF